MRARRDARLAPFLQLIAAVAVAGCGIGAGRVPIPTAVPSPSQAVSAPVGATAAAIDRALSGVGLRSVPAQVAYRPGESPRLAAAPRMVVQAVLPNDQTHGMIVVYEYPDADAALAAGNEMAGYLRSGPGRVQFVPDARFTLRQLGSTLVFFSWSPANSPDPHTADITTALNALGTDIPIVR